MIAGSGSVDIFWGSIGTMKYYIADLLVACIGGGSNALGLFHEFLDDTQVSMLAVEAAGLGLNTNKQ